MQWKNLWKYLSLVNICNHKKLHRKQEIIERPSPNSQEWWKTALEQPPHVFKDLRITPNHHNDKLEVSWQIYNTTPINNQIFHEKKKKRYLKKTRSTLKSFYAKKFNYYKENWMQNWQLYPINNPLSSRKKKKDENKKHK